VREAKLQEEHHNKMFPLSLKQRSQRDAYATEHPPAVARFCYGSEGVDDHGWGCCYRSLQNVLCVLGVSPVPHINTLVDISNNRPRSKWVEPAQLVRAVPDACTTESAVALLSGRAQEAMLFTTPADYTHTFVEREALEAWVRAALDAGGALLLDNGTCSYAMDARSAVCTLYDPHTSNPSAVPSTVDLHELLSRWDTCMCMAVFR
jgi:hypothetical protein